MTDFELGYNELTMACRCIIFNCSIPSVKAATACSLKKIQINNPSIHVHMKNNMWELWLSQQSTRRTNTQRTRTTILEATWHNECDALTHDKLRARTLANVSDVEILFWCDVEHTIENCNLETISPAVLKRGIMLTVALLLSWLIHIWFDTIEERQCV